MNSLKFQDLIPRPSPKPSQIEVPVVSTVPEVPEASLLFDPSVQKVEPLKVLSSTNPTDQQKYIGNVSLPFRTSPPNWERKAHTKHEHSSCCCSLNPESPRVVGDVSTPPRLDYTLSNPPNLNFVHQGKNSACTRNLCSHLSSCSQNYRADFNTTNTNESFVTLDEYQKMVSQFTKMILNLNYKFNQVLDSSISHEELNRITKRFELQIENLNQRVNDLNSKLEKTNSELASYRVVDYKGSVRSCESAPRQNVECKCCQIDDRPTSNFERECNDGLQELRQSPKSPGVMKTCPRSNIQQNCDQEYRDCRRMGVEDVQRERFSGGRLSLRGGLPIDLTRENNDLEHVMGSLDLVTQNDLLKQCYSGRELKISTNDVITPADMSRLMNTLATKYIPEGQCDMKKQDTRQEPEAIVRNDCNNVSIATLQYMERYQLLSSTNQNSTKSLGVSKTRAVSNQHQQQQFHHQETQEGNDRSFLR